MWTKYIQSKVLSRVKQEGLETLTTKYPDLYYTTEEESLAEPKFPTCYIHELPGTEQGGDLEGTTINAVYTTIQIDVTDNISKTRVKDVLDKATETMKSMRFRVTTPEITTSQGVHKGTARYERIIAQGDIY